MVLRVKGAILIGILISTVIGMFNGVTQVPQSIGDLVGAPASLAPIMFKLDFVGALKLGFMVIFSLVFVDMFDTLGTLMGTSARAGFMDKDGRLPQMRGAMIVDAIGTMFGGVLGISTVTNYVNLLPVFPTAAKQVLLRNHRGALPVSPFLYPTGTNCAWCSHCAGAGNCRGLNDGCGYGN